ncbi:ABC transporter permease [Cellulosimicrobium sp. Marseille-Q4280]|uniref:ABC transporter permease n=1 Tax=Cellulosimicrobium sp. Marseille-Q4280 TaxID=2937992 RepID=UPI00203E2588|nr:ABC transporter permease [Cellulosimicrobium sp. Marseille-Q4280]
MTTTRPARQTDRPVERAVPGGASLSPWGAIRLVAGREITTRLRSKSFVWLTVILVGAVVLGGFVLNAASSSGPTAERVGVTSTTADLAGAITATGEALGTEVETVEVSDDAAGEQQVRDGDLDALVTGSADDLTVVVDSELSTGLTAVFTTLAQQSALADAVTALGGDPAQVAGDVATAEPTVRTIGEPSEFDPTRYVTGLVTGVLLFMAIMISGQLIAQGVVEEKTSRVVELLLSTVRPWQLMAGKVLGIGLVGLGQVALVVAAGVGTALGLGLVDTSTIDLGAAAAWALVWFVVGFVSYALLMAGLGALVSRQEDVGAVTTPVTFLMVVPYIVGVSVAPWAPDNPLVVWLSYVPLCSPLLMPVRIALGSAETWEVLLALGLSLALIPVLVWLAAKIYSNAVLRTGARVKLKDALRTT